MVYFPLLEKIVEYFKEVWAYGFTYCLWGVVVGVLIGAGIGLGNIKMIIVGVCLWVVGGLIYGISFKGKEKEKDQ